MAGNQLVTSVTILNSLKGFQAISLTEYDTSAAAAIASGSVVEIAGAYFTFAGDETINASSWTSVTTGTTAYIELTPAGTAGSQVVTAAYSSTAPIWRDDLQGWYASAASNSRAIGSVYKAEATNYARKYIIDSLQQDYGRNYRWRGEIERITSGSGNWITPAGVYKIRVTCVGGGGNGQDGTTGRGGCGGGGTNISLVIGSVINVVPGQSIAYSVGGAGTQTTFTGATTGAAGAAGSAGGAGATGGAGSAGNYGQESSVGGAGGGAGGYGGVPAVGTGGAGGAGGYGGGGGGGGTGSSAGGAGGAGGSGIIIIEY